MEEMLGKTIGKYRIEELIGEGRSAVVYRGVDDELQTVVVKVFHSIGEIDVALLENFKTDVQLLSRVQHPNIVKIRDFGEQDGFLYLVMDYLPGGTLKERLGKPILAEEATELISKLAGALAVACGLGVIHRNIRPSNILFTETGSPILTDFGITCLQTIGTGVDYLAPEQGLGGMATSKTDQYALGEMYYEMLTGRRPFDADTSMAMVRKKAMENLVDPSQFVPDLPDAVVDILYLVLSPDAEDRYADMTKFKKALNAFGEQQLIESLVVADVESNDKDHPGLALTVTEDAMPIPVSEKPFTPEEREEEFSAQGDSGQSKESDVSVEAAEDELVNPFLLMDDEQKHIENETINRTGKWKKWGIGLSFVILVFWGWCG